MTANLDSQIGRRRRPTDFSRRIFIPSRSRTFSVLLVLTAQLQIKSFPTSHPGHHDAPDFLCGCLPTTLQTRKRTEGPMCPFLHRTTNTISLPIDIDHDRPCGIVVPRTHTSSSLCASIFHRLEYSGSCASFLGSSRRPCRRRGWECGYPTHSYVRKRDGADGCAGIYF